MNGRSTETFLLIALLWLVLALPTYAKTRSDFCEGRIVSLADDVPSIRAYHGMAYDIESNVVVVFSGISELGLSGNELRDTWAFSPSSKTWTNMDLNEMPTGGDRRGWMAYDSKNDVIILFGGWETPETWAYDYNNNNWTNLQPSMSPPGRDAHTMVYDSQSERMILFGGRPSIYEPWTFLHDTWAYDYEMNTWTNVTPDISPEGRWFHGMSYDSKADRVILFGGGGKEVVTIRQDYAGVMNDTWAFDFESRTWEEVSPAVSPGRRGYPAMVFDASVNRTILYGGSLGGGGGAYEDILYDDTWSYNYADNAWTKMNPTNNPGKRMRHSMVYADSMHQNILFGGQLDDENNVFNAETWAYDFDLNTWTSLSATVDAFDPTWIILGAGAVAIVFIVAVVYVRKR